MTPFFRKRPVQGFSAGIQGGLAKQLEDETTIPTNDRELIRGRALFARELPSGGAVATTTLHKRYGIVLERVLLQAVEHPLA